jgi:hypothetical protein
MRKASLIRVITPLTAFALFPYHSLADTSNQTALNKVVQQYQQTCTEVQPLPDIDAEDLDKPPPAKLTLDKSNIYEVLIHSSGTKAIVLYPEFHCQNVGYGWCGTAGCGFYVIVDGKIFHRLNGFKPQSAIVETESGSDRILVFGLHGGGCEDAKGRIGAGVDPCYGTAVWDERNRTFYSKEELRLWGFD